MLESWFYFRRYDKSCTDFKRTVLEPQASSLKLSALGQAKGKSRALLQERFLKSQRNQDFEKKKYGRKNSDVTAMSQLCNKFTSNFPSAQAQLLS